MIDFKLTCELLGRFVNSPLCYLISFKPTSELLSWYFNKFPVYSLILSFFWSEELRQVDLHVMTGAAVLLVMWARVGKNPRWGMFLQKKQEN
jgi:hypothetical protein